MAIAALAGAAQLSPREIEIVELTVAGLSRAEMRARLEVAENTLKSQVRKVVTKCGEPDLGAIARRVLAAAVER